MARYPLQKLLSEKHLQEIDISFANLMHHLSGDTSSEALKLAAALCSHTTTQERHICLDLGTSANRPFIELFPEFSEDTTGSEMEWVTPDLQTWQNALQTAKVVGTPGEYTPLVLDSENRLYLHKYWQYEQKLADLIAFKLKQPPLVDISTLNQNQLDQYFRNPKSTPDWQRVAAFMALTRNFSVISGGPGTGKTHTVTSILALLLEQNPSLKITICAPTGKAAARLQDSIRKAKTNLDCSDKLKALIPETASTIHRLLGTRPNSPEFVHNRQRRLTADIVIVDEASMVSLALMSRLFQATQDKAGIILLGDRNQLSSVEAGAVLANICESGSPGTFSSAFCDSFNRISHPPLPQLDETADRNPINDSLVELGYSYRFEKSPEIGKISAIVKDGDGSAMDRFFEQAPPGAITRKPLPQADELQQRLQSMISEKLLKAFNTGSLADAHQIFESLKILCSHRHGKNGVHEINGLIEQVLTEKGLVKPGSTFYKGRPIIIKQNNYQLQLYNGDTGIIWEDSNGTLKAFFPAEDGEFKKISPARLPVHDSVFAMTIHESQGSEYDEVYLVISAGRGGFLSRELLYTGITRSKRTVEIWAEDQTLHQTIARKVQRESGLKATLKSLLQ